MHPNGAESEGKAGSPVFAAKGAGRRRLVRTTIRAGLLCLTVWVAAVIAAIAGFRELPGVPLPQIGPLDNDASDSPLKPEPTIIAAVGPADSATAAAPALWRRRSEVHRLVPLKVAARGYRGSSRGQTGARQNGIRQGSARGEGNDQGDGARGDQALGRPATPMVQPESPALPSTTPITDAPNRRDWDDNSDRQRQTSDRNSWDSTRPDTSRSYNRDGNPSPSVPSDDRPDDRDYSREDRLEPTSEDDRSWGGAKGGWNRDKGSRRRGRWGGR